MSSNETTSPLETMSAAMHAATKLTNESESPAKLTPNILASAIKLAALSSETQEQLTPANINAAIKVAKKSSNQHEKHKPLTPETLAMALKLATKASSNDKSTHEDEKDTDDMSADQMLTAMKGAIVMTQKEHSDDLATTEMLSDALKLAKE